MVILIIGLPGSGKTFFAERLAKKLNAVHLNSDRVRKKTGEWSKYSDASKRSVYDAMLQMMQNEIASGKEVIVDATFFKKTFRDKFINTLRQSEQRFKIIEVKASEETVRQRLSQPRADSEADFEVYKILKSRFEPVTEAHLVLHSDIDSADEMIKKAMEYLAQS
ncbi:MAG TPA: ATP-binding protein [Chitinophagales bacterium]|nr:ATP-binding protein [Chitinophagales bacterium]